MRRLHRESHWISRIGWLRAAVLGANDGLISTASLLVGIAASAASKESILLVGVAGLVAGAMSMAAGEYVSVSSQYDTEQADLARERRELSDSPASELVELAHIYEQRGVEKELAYKVAEQMTARNALEAHARDELGLSEHTSARPIQAALTSAATFAVGAALPLFTVVISPVAFLVPVLSASTLVFLAILGAVGAHAGGANLVRATLRVTFWGALALVVTAVIGKVFGAVV